MGGQKRKTNFLLLNVLCFLPFFVRDVGGGGEKWEKKGNFKGSRNEFGKKEQETFIADFFSRK